MAIIWNEVKRNEKPDFRSTVEDRLESTGVLDTIRLSRVRLYGPPTQEKKEKETNNGEELFLDVSESNGS